MPSKRLTRSRNSMMCGVCAGVAEYFDTDPTVVRVATVLLTFLTGLLPLIAVYLICCLIIPKSSL